MSRNAIILVLAGLAFIILAGYVYDQNRKIDDLQKTLISQQSTKKLQQTSNGYSQSSKGVKYDQSDRNIELATAELSSRKKNYRDHWRDFIELRENEYLTREIGGIFDLEIRLKNKFDAPIEQLTGTITYIKANGDILKVVDVVFTNVEPNSTVKKTIEDSSRGVKIKLDLISFNVNSYDLCFPGNNRIESDPYYCGL